VKYPLISADSHVIEPADLWRRRLPARFLGGAPTVSKGSDGRSAWVVEGHAPIPLPISAVNGSEYRDLGRDAPQTVAFEHLLPGCYDPRERLKLQDADSVNAEILYPYPPLWDAIKRLRDPELRRACYRAYNDWIAEFSAVDPDRLVGLGKLPNTGIEDATSEIERCGTQLKLKGVVLDGWPAGGPAPDAQEDRFWEVAQALGLPVSIHFALGDEDTAPAPIITPGASPPLASAIMPLAASGVFDRFPDLKIVAAHGNSGWLPAEAEAFDNQYLRTAATRQSSLANPDWMPSDYARRFFWYTFQHDRFAVTNRHRIGVAHLMWASHFPLDGSDWPDHKARAELVTQEVSPEDKERLLATNCARLYRLPGYQGAFAAEEVSAYQQLLFL
jgi:predicted TIM-barrel fold metal-dependent hydrolase